MDTLAEAARDPLALDFAIHVFVPGTGIAVAGPGLFYDNRSVRGGATPLFGRLAIKAQPPRGRGFFILPYEKTDFVYYRCVFDSYLLQPK